MNLSAKPLLAAASALCVAGLAFVAATGDWHWTPPSAQKPGDDMFRAEALSLARVDPGSLQQMVERPLLQSDRRPPAVDKVATNEPDPLANVQLLGVFGSGTTGGVLLKAEERVSRLRVGERTGRWTLQAVGAAQADFITADGRRSSLVLQRQPQPGAVPSAPQPASAAPAPLNTVAAPSAPVSPEMAERARQRAERAAAIAERARNKPPAQAGQ